MVDVNRDRRDTRDFSAWTGGISYGAAELVPANPPKRLEASGAPIVEQSHEYVIPKRDA